MSRKSELSQLVTKGYLDEKIDELAAIVRSYISSSKNTNLSSLEKTKRPLGR